jgi:hypothetical protein
MTLTHYIFDVLSVVSALWLGLIIGSAWQRRRWTRTVRRHLPGSETVMIDDATGLENGDIIVAFDSRTGRPRRRE